jgi:hypothetical protein
LAHIKEKKVIKFFPSAEKKFSAFLRGLQLNQILKSKTITGFKSEIRLKSGFEFRNPNQNLIRNRFNPDLKSEMRIKTGDQNLKSGFQTGFKK